MDEKQRQATKLWALAQPTVSAFLGSVVRNFRDRDDLLQETAVAVIESFDRYDAAQSFVGWALGIARNQVGLYLRKRDRNPIIFDTEATERLAAAFEAVTTDENRPLDYLRDCLQGLEGRSRRICDLRYRDDLKPAAIAPAVGMSANAVAQALYRIREQLRHCIERKSALVSG